MGDIEEIGRSLELPIGTRFYFNNRLYEVAELEDDGWGCSQCALAGDEAICEIMKCNGYRQDKKRIFFKEVKEAEEENND